MFHRQLSAFRVARIVAGMLQGSAIAGPDLAPLQLGDGCQRILAKPEPRELRGLELFIGLAHQAQRARTIERRKEVAACDPSRIDIPQTLKKVPAAGHHVDDSLDAHLQKGWIFQFRAGPGGRELASRTQFIQWGKESGAKSWVCEFRGSSIGVSDMHALAWRNQSGKAMQ